MAEDYSNETLGVMIKDLKEVVNEGFKITHKKQDKTNGKVRSLEVWRGYITGSVAVVVLVLGYVISFLK